MACGGPVWWTPRPWRGGTAEILVENAARTRRRSPTQAWCVRGTLALCLKVLHGENHRH